MKNVFQPDASRATVKLEVVNPVENFHQIPEDYRNIEKFSKMLKVDENNYALSIRNMFKDESLCFFFTLTGMGSFLWVIAFILSVTVVDNFDYFYNVLSAIVPCLIMWAITGLFVPIALKENRTNYSTAIKFRKEAENFIKSDGRLTKIQSAYNSLNSSDSNNAVARQLISSQWTQVVDSIRDESTLKESSEPMRIARELSEDLSTGSRSSAKLLTASRTDDSFLQDVVRKDIAGAHKMGVNLDLRA